MHRTFFARIFVVICFVATSTFHLHADDTHNPTAAEALALHALHTTAKLWAHVSDSVTSADTQSAPLEGIVIINNGRREHADLIKPSDTLIIKDRSDIVTPGITRVIIRGTVDVVLQQDSQPRLHVKTHENIEPFVTTKVNGNTLYIDMDPVSFSRTKQLVVHLTLPQLTYLESKGLGTIDVGTITSPEDLTIECGSAGTLKTKDMNIKKLTLIAGNTADASLATINLTQDAVIVLSGTGDITIKNLTSPTKATIITRNTGTTTINQLNAPHQCLTSSGSSEITVHHTKGQELTASATNISHITLKKGSIDTQTISVADASEFRSKKVPGKKGIVTCRNIGEAHVNIADLEQHSSGMGTITNAYRK